MNNLPPPCIRNYLKTIEGCRESILTDTLEKKEKRDFSGAICKISEKVINKFSEDFNLGLENVYSKDNFRETLEKIYASAFLGKSTFVQLITSLIFDAAMSDLVRAPRIFAYRTIVNNKGIVERFSSSFDLPPISSNVQTCSYLDNSKIETNCLISDKPILSFDENGLTPILKRFFYFTDIEWEKFGEIVKEFPLSEQKFQLIPVPEYGSWSNVLRHIQKVTHLFNEVQVFTTPANQNIIFNQKMMPVPSFSMFQAFIDIKAESLGRETLKLLPIFNPLNQKQYFKLKFGGNIPVGLYFPLNNKYKRYSTQLDPNFLQMIDGWQNEGPYIFFLHDIYHALREMQMKPEIVLAITRIADLLKDRDFTLYTKLLDGELIFSYPKSDGSPLKEHSYHSNQKICDIANHIEQKTVFINTLVIDILQNKEEWKESFGISKESLCDTHLQDYLLQEKNIQSYGNAFPFYLTQGLSAEEVIRKKEQFIKNISDFHKPITEESKEFYKNSIMVHEIEKYAQLKKVLRVQLKKIFTDAVNSEEQVKDMQFSQKIVDHFKDESALRKLSSIGEVETVLHAYTHDHLALDKLLNYQEKDHISLAKSHLKKAYKSFWKGETVYLPLLARLIHDKKIGKFSLEEEEPFNVENLSNAIFNRLVNLGVQEAIKVQNEENGICDKEELSFEEADAKTSSLFEEKDWNIFTSIADLSQIKELYQNKNTKQLENTIISSLDPSSNYRMRWSTTMVTLTLALKNTDISKLFVKALFDEEYNHPLLNTVEQVKYAILYALVKEGNETGVKKLLELAISQENEEIANSAKKILKENLLKITNLDLAEEVLSYFYKNKKEELLKLIALNNMLKSSSE